VIKGIYNCFEIVPNNVAITNIKIINNYLQGYYNDAGQAIEIYTLGSATMKDIWIENNTMVKTGLTGTNHFGIGMFGYGSHIERVYITNNTFKFDCASSKQIVMDFRTTNPATLSKIMIVGNNIDVTGATTNYCIRLGAGTLDAINLVGNYIKCDAGYVVDYGAGTYTNIEQSGNIIV